MDVPSPSHSAHLPIGIVLLMKEEGPSPASFSAATMKVCCRQSLDAWSRNVTEVSSVMLTRFIERPVTVKWYTISTPSRPPLGGCQLKTSSSRSLELAGSRESVVGAPGRPVQ